MTGTLYTDVPPYPHYTAGEVDRVTFCVTHAATLRLTKDFMVGDIYQTSSDAVLDLDLNTLRVTALSNSPPVDPPPPR